MLFGAWQDLFRTVASCLTPEMSEKPNYALASVLDASDQPTENGSGPVAAENGEHKELDLQRAVDGECTVGQETLFVADLP